MHGDRLGTNKLILDTLIGQLRDAEHKLDLQKAAMADLNEKTAEVESNVRTREHELAEMKKLIELKAEHGRKLQADAQAQANENREL